MPRLSWSANHSKLWIAIGACLAAWAGRFGRRAGLRGLGSVAVTSALVNLALKRIFRRHRPSLRSVPALRRLSRQPSSTSFPSGHAASAGAFATGAASELPATALPIGAAAAAVAYSRVYTGVHYPSDVVVGAAIGVAIGLLSKRLSPRANAPSK